MRTTVARETTHHRHAHYIIQTVKTPAQTICLPPHVQRAPTGVNIYDFYQIELRKGGGLEGEKSVQQQTVLVNNCNRHGESEWFIHSLVKCIGCLNNFRLKFI